MNITEQIDTAISETMNQVAAAAKRQDIVVLEHMTKKASELKAMKDQVGAIQRRFQALTQGATPLNNPGNSTTPIRELTIDVSQGMINQNLLTLSVHMKRGIIEPNEVLNIEALPSGDRFTTELLASGNKLRERGKIAKFYRDARVQAGDVVVLKEISPRRWQLMKGEITRYRRI